MEQPDKAMIRTENRFAKYADGTEFLFVPIEKEDKSALNLCDSIHLLERNTKSFLCLAQLLMSKSSLTENKNFLFPPLEDPGISLAFKYVEPRPEIDDIGAKIYKAKCKEMHIIPISKILVCLPTNTLNMKYYGLSENQIEALTEALQINNYVQNVIFDENILNTEMMRMLSDTLSENICIQTLSLRECRIGKEGAEELGQALSGLGTLEFLDLSCNDLGDQGLAFLENGLTNNTSIRILNLSHNNLTEESGVIFERIFLLNNTIENLNLSWNGFFTAQGTKKLFSGFFQTDKIKVLNISWNGIGIPQAVQPLTRYLRKSKALEELDLSNNRLAGDAMKLIVAAVKNNHSLHCLKIRNNIYPAEEAHALLTTLAAKTKDPLYYLDMDNVYINKEFKPIFNTVTKMGKIVKIAGILSDYQIIGPNPRKLIYNRCKYLLNKPKKVKARKDFGHFILSLPSNPVTQDEFQKQLKKLKMKKLDKDLIQGLMNLFLTKQNEVNCPELIKDYMSFYPDTVLPPPKPKKAKKGKKNKKGKLKEEVEIKVHDLENADEVGIETIADAIKDQNANEKENITPTSQMKVENIPQK